MQDANAEQLWVYQQNRHMSLSNTTATGYGYEGAQGKHHWGDHPSCVMVLPLPTISLPAQLPSAPPS